MKTSARHAIITIATYWCAAIAFASGVSLMIDLYAYLDWRYRMTDVVRYLVLFAMSASGFAALWAVQTWPSPESRDKPTLVPPPPAQTDYQRLKIRRAREMYSVPLEQNVQIYDTATVDCGVDGAWVAAWVFVPNKESKTIDRIAQ